MFLKAVAIANVILCLIEGKGRFSVAKIILNNKEPAVISQYQEVIVPTVSHHSLLSVSLFFYQGGIDSLRSVYNAFLPFL